MRKNKVFSMLATVVMIGGMIGLSGCSKDEAKTVNYLMCSQTPESEALNGYEFKLAEDGKTIEELTFKVGFNEAAMKKAWPGTDIDEAYYNAEYYVYGAFETMTSENANCPWIKGMVKDNPDTHEVQMLLVFDFTDETFDATDEATREYLNAYKIYDMFYNEDEMKFEVTEKQLENMDYGSDVKNVCEVKTFEEDNLEGTASYEVDKSTQETKKADK